MIRQRNILIAVGLLLVFVFLAFSNPIITAQSDAVTNARQQIIACHLAAQDAEAAGANITSLNAILNNAGVLLSQAELAYSEHDFGKAQNLASQSTSLLDNFIPQAHALRDAAIGQQTSDFMIMIGSIAGTFLILGIGVAVWFFLNRETRVSIRPVGVES